MKTITTRDLTVVLRNFDGKSEPLLIKKGTVIADLKEPKTGTFTALVPDHGHRVEFLDLNIDAFMEVED